MSAQAGHIPSAAGGGLDIRGASHPLAGQTMTGADMVIQVLADEGVEFGSHGAVLLEDAEYLVCTFRE